MRKFINWKVLLMVGAAFLLLTATSTFADTVDLQLTIPNSAISGYTGPYADITISIVGGVADFKVTTLSNATNQYYLGGANAFGFVSTVAGTIGAIVEDGIFTSVTAGNEDGFGAFNYQIKNFDGTKDAFSTLTFTFTGTSAFTNVSDFLGKNANGFSVAGHVFVCSAGQTQAECAAGTGALATGYAATLVPEPSALLLLATGLFGAFVSRKKRV